MTNIEFLNTYREKQAELRTLRGTIARIGSTGKPSGANTIDYSQVMRSTNNRSSAEYQLYEGLASQIADLQEQLAPMDLRFQELIEEARNYKERCILRFYYHQGLTNEETAECLNISARHASRLRKALLQYLQ